MVDIDCTLCRFCLFICSYCFCKVEEPQLIADEPDLQKLLELLPDQPLIAPELRLVSQSLVDFEKAVSKVDQTKIDIQKAEELEARQALEAVAKQKAEKPTLKEFVLGFLRSTEKLEDDLAFEAITKVLHSEASNDKIAQTLFALNSSEINQAVLSWGEIDVSGDITAEEIT